MADAGLRQIVRSIIYIPHFRSSLNFLAAPFGTQEYLFRKSGRVGIHHTVVNGNPVLTLPLKGTS